MQHDGENAGEHLRSIPANLLPVMIVRDTGSCADH